MRAAKACCRVIVDARARDIRGGGGGREAVAAVGAAAGKCEGNLGVK